MNIIDIEKSEDRELIIKTSSLDKKIEYVKEGFFLDILYQDTNPEVRIEVAKKSAYLEELKNDSDYLVKLEVLKKKGLEFMQFQDLNKEHLSIIEEAVKQGFPSQKLDYNSNMQIKLLVLKEKGLKKFVKKLKLLKGSSVMMIPFPEGKGTSLLMMMI